MFPRFLLIVFAIAFASGLLAQPAGFRFPAKELSDFNSKALLRIRSGDTVIKGCGNNFGVIPGAGQLMQVKAAFSSKMPSVNISDRNFISADTLYIGDTLEISGTWIHSGPIVIYNSGFLYFNKASATILGDIYLIGDHPKLIADSSTLFIPQAYFYQRVLFGTGGAEVIYRNTTVDHSGLSHNVIMIDNARLELRNVINKGFTTNGFYSHASIFVNKINEAGEYIMLDESVLEFHHANTLLLWHQFPKDAIINFEFPEGDTTYNYHFSSNPPGVSGIHYLVTADSCTDVMWGMMPANGSDVTIANSDIRSIGLWFMGNDTSDVSGLVDNSSYSDFLAPLTDRTLKLHNCKVTTWSIYPMQKSYVNLSDCIVGEVGTGGTSGLTGSQFFCDGSGGYVWSSDSSILIAGFSYTSGFVRSQANSFLIYAYSSLGGGFPSALQNSVIMAIQCTLPQEPKALDKGVAWYVYIDKPFEANAGEMVTITGSVWIDKTTASNLMDFGSYRMYYQIPDAEDWLEIPVDSLHEKRNEPLAIWNTTGLLPGQYLLKLVLTDNWGNSIEGVKSIMLLPVFGIAEKNPDDLWVYPNPAGKLVHIQRSNSSGTTEVKIQNFLGETLILKQFSASELIMGCSFSLETLATGTYVISVTDTGKCLTRQLIVR